MILTWFTSFVFLMYSLGEFLLLSDLDLQGSGVFFDYMFYDIR